MGNSNFSDVVADTFTGAVTGDVTGAISGALTFPTVSRTTTTAGDGTGLIADSGMFQFVNVTSGGATTILTLPTPTPGTIVMLGAAGTAFELRTNAPSTVGINGGTGSAVESAIATNSTVFLFCSAATDWAGWEIIAGTTFAAVEAAA